MVIIGYAKETLANGEKGGNPDVRVIEQKGKSDGANPLGLKN